MALKKGQWLCGECHRVNEDRYGVCFSCGQTRQAVDHFKREYPRLTGREKDTIKTFIVNHITEFRDRNISLIQQDWQLETQNGLRDIWDSVAQYVASLETRQIKEE